MKWRPAFEGANGASGPAEAEPTTLAGTRNGGLSLSGRRSARVGGVLVRSPAKLRVRARRCEERQSQRCPTSPWLAAPAAQRGRDSVSRPGEGVAPSPEKV